MYSNLPKSLPQPTYIRVHVHCTVHAFPKFFVLFQNNKAQFLQSSFRLASMTFVWVGFVRLDRCATRSIGRASPPTASTATSTTTTTSSDQVGLLLLYMYLMGNCSVKILGTVITVHLRHWWHRLVRRGNLRQTRLLLQPFERPLRYLQCWLIWLLYII